MTAFQPSRRHILLHACQLADVTMMVAALVAAIAWSATVARVEWRDLFAVRVSLSNVLLVTGLAVAWHLIFRFVGLYRSRRIESASAEWWAGLKAVALGTLLLSGAALIFRLSAVNGSVLLMFFILALLGTQLMRALLGLVLVGARRHGRNLRRVVIVGCGPRGHWFGRAIRNRPDWGYLLEGYIDDLPAPMNPLHGGAERHLGSLADIEKLLESSEVDEVFVALPVRSHYETIAKVIALAEDLGLTVRMPADSFELQLTRASVDVIGHNPVLTLTAPNPGAARLATKRVIDFTAATLALIVLAPLLAVIALLIRLDSRGPAFFVQERVGLGRKTFRLFKFRTMVPDAESQIEQLEELNESSGAAFKMSRDPRITRMGRFLRKFSLDELPQLLNIVNGDLSLVGPRPLPLRDVNKMEARWQKRRFSIKPGLTCLWQVSGRHEVNFEHWMELDLQYIDNWSLTLDFNILARTVPAVLRGTGS